MQTAKQDAQSMIRDLPDDASYEDIIYRLHVLETVRDRLEAADAGQVVTHDHVKQRLAAWRQG